MWFNSKKKKSSSDLESLKKLFPFNKKSSFPDFENADYYICGKESLELLKCVKGITINDVDTSSNKTVKVGDWNGKPIFYNPSVPKNEIIGLNKPKDDMYKEPQNESQAISEKEE